MTNDFPFTPEVEDIVDIVEELESERVEIGRIMAQNEDKGESESEHEELENITQEYEQKIKQRFRELDQTAIIDRDYRESSEGISETGLAVRGRDAFEGSTNTSLQNIFVYGRDVLEESKDSEVFNCYFVGRDALYDSVNPIIVDSTVTGRDVLEDSVNPIIVDSTVTGRDALYRSENPVMVNVEHESRKSVPEDAEIYELDEGQIQELKWDLSNSDNPYEIANKYLEHIE
ncbi:DUF3737 family protein [Nanohaloarchaea archaeon]|nr:DUF3737 family protein [Candidatus Nanohaloarchaea archaeon]